MPFAKPFTLSLALLSFALATACGNDSSFEGSTNQVPKKSENVVLAPPTTVPVTTVPDEPPPPPPPLPEGRSYSALTWFWQCETDPAAVPDAPADDAIVLQGIGPHHFTSDQVEGSPISIRGRLCKPQTLKRDLVFVIDTSGSMGQNDRLVGTSCGRLTAIRQVLLALAGEGAGVSNFAIVTFNSQLDRTSTRLFDNANLLFAELAGAGDIADVVCNAKGGTNYDAGLTRAAEILTLGRPDASKEVYFVSDGQPDGGDGVALATSMKSVGVTVGSKVIPVTIATIMLAGTDKVLETQIASKDSTGKPMYGYVAQVGGLAKVLSDLTHNEIVGAEFKYRAIGASNWTTLDLLTHLDAQFNFVLPSFKIEVSKEPKGLEVEYEYSDRHDNKFSTGGKLLWTVEDAPASAP